MVNGGVVVIGDGIVDIAGSSGESVRFLSNDSGGLEIADTKGHTSAFSGRVSGFGGSGHTNQAQFVDLVSVTSAGLITSHYTSAAGNTSGTLTVSSGGTLVASIKFVGAYSAGDFHITSGNGGTVAITDPAVPNGGSVELGVSDVAIGAHTTLAYSENNTAPSLGMTEGRYAATLALLGNYMAGSFATTAGGMRHVDFEHAPNRAPIAVDASAAWVTHRRQQSRIDGRIGNNPCRRWLLPGEHVDGFLRTRELRQTN